MSEGYAFKPNDVQRIGQVCKAYEQGKLTQQTPQRGAGRKPPVETWGARATGDITALTSVGTGWHCGSGNADLYTLDAESYIVSGSLALQRKANINVVNLGCHIPDETWLTLIRDPISGAFFCQPSTCPPDADVGCQLVAVSCATGGGLMGTYMYYDKQYVYFDDVPCPTPPTGSSSSGSSGSSGSGSSESSMSSGFGLAPPIPELTQCSSSSSSKALAW